MIRLKTPITYYGANKDAPVFVSKKPKEYRLYNEVFCGGLLCSLQVNRQRLKC